MYSAEIKIDDLSSQVCFSFKKIVSIKFPAASVIGKKISQKNSLQNLLSENFFPTLLKSKKLLKRHLLKMLKKV